MYTKEEREGIPWGFHRSGLTIQEACGRLPLFPTAKNLAKWLRMERAGQNAAREMPDRPSRMHCTHGEGSPAYAHRHAKVAHTARDVGSPKIRLADVCETLSIPKSTYLDQRVRLDRPDPEALLRVRVRASFEASEGRFGSESICTDLRHTDGEAMPWRKLEQGDMETPIIVSEKVIRRIMAEEGLIARKTRQTRREARLLAHLEAP